MRLLSKLDVFDKLRTASNPYQIYTVYRKRKEQSENFHSCARRMIRTQPLMTIVAKHRLASASVHNRVGLIDFAKLKLFDGL